jgi:N-acetylneuraminic acid mutarotase
MARWRTVAAALVALAATPAATASARAWHELSPLPEPRLQPGMAEVDGRLYVVAGQGRFDPAQNFLPEATTFVYDPSARVWSSGPALPVALATPALVASGGTLYVVGGMTDMASWPSHFSTAVYRLDGRAWSAVTEVPHVRWRGLAVAGWHGRIWWLGGYGPNAGYPHTRRAVDVYLPAADRWVTRTPFPRGHTIYAATALAGHPWVFAAGRDGLGAWTYRRGGWTERGAVRPPRGLYSWNGLSAAAGADGRLYVVGGYTEVFSLAVADNVVIAFNPRTRRWRTQPGLPSRGGFPSLARLGNRVVAAGGIDDEQAVLVPDVHALPAGR